MKPDETHVRYRLVVALTLALLAGCLLVAVGPHPAGTAAAEGPAGALPEPDFQLLSNPGMEAYDAPYGQWYGVDCQGATGWVRFSIGALDPCWMDTRVFAESWLGSGWVERIEGETSQLLVSVSPYTAGLRQSVAGLTPGVGYGFHAAMLTIYRSSAWPQEHGKMIKQVGIDPTGGSDPNAPTVIWSPPNDHDKEWDLQRRVAAIAQSSTVTVFIQVDSPFESGGLPFMNLSILDSAILAQTPAVEATSPQESYGTEFTVTWDNVQMPPGELQFKGVDVQWMDEAEGVWHDWFIQTFDGQAAFDGERGHTYRFRARAWARYPSNAWLHGPYREEGDTFTLVADARLAGQVVSPKGLPVAGATVAILGTGWMVQTAGDGLYVLPVEPGEPRIATVRHRWWASPPPALDLTFGVTETVGLTWTMRPPADAVENGQFEEGLAGWDVLGEPDIPPQVVDEPVHTGEGSLQIGGEEAGSFTTGVSQTVSLQNAWEPVLSLWYQPDTGGAEARLNIVAEVSGLGDDPGDPVSMTQILTPNLEVDGWHTVWLRAGPERSAFTGTITLKLLLRADGQEEDVAVYLDEVSLGASPGGRHRVSMPLVFR